MAPQKQHIQDSHDPRYGTMIVQTIVSRTRLLNWLIIFSLLNDNKILRLSVLHKGEFFIILEGPVLKLQFNPICHTT